MTDTLKFWKEWDKKERLILFIMLTLVGVASLFLWFAYANGPGFVIGWETIKEMVPSTVEKYWGDSGGYKVFITIDQFLIFQYFQGTSLSVEPVFWYMYLLCMVIGMNLVLAVLPSMSKFWFYGAMAGFIGFIILLQPDQVLLFGQSDKSASIIILSLYLTVSYIFREFKSQTPFLIRFLIFSGITLLIVLFIHFFSGVHHPFLFIAGYGITAPMVVSIFFIFSISHEIIFGFLFLAASSTTGRTRAVFHFTVLSILYLGYVFITYLYNTRRITWDLVYLNPVVVLVVCLVLGLWGLRRREPLFNQIFPFRPAGAFFYLSFGLITIALYTFILTTGNDPLAETMEDAVIFSQLGFGVFFYLYIIANFATLFSRELDVLKVVYLSRVLPFFVFRAGGLVVVGFLIYQSTLVPFYQARAGFYNFLGDLFLIENQLAPAKEYYEKSSDYAYRNHRANYALAALSKIRQEKNDEVYYLEQSLIKNPSDYAYVNIANLYFRNNQYFEGLFKLQEGFKLFPNSSRLNNNLGFLYSKTDIYDSAYYFFERARRINPRLGEIRTNSYALLAKSGIPFSMDSVIQEIGDPDKLSDAVNLCALANINPQVMPIADNLPNDSIWLHEEFALFINQAINRLDAGDTGFFNHMTRRSEYVQNSYFQNQLMLASSLGKFRNHQVGESLQILKNLTESMVDNNPALDLLGRLYLTLHDDISAFEVFERIQGRVSIQTRFYHALASMGAMEFETAKNILNGLDRRDESISRSSEELLKIMDVKAWSPEMNDSMKLAIFRYRKDLLDDRSFSHFLSGIKNQAVKFSIVNEKCEEFLDTRRYQEALQYFKLAGAVEPRPNSVLFNKNWLRLSLAGMDSIPSLDSDLYLNTEISDPLYLFIQSHHLNNMLSEGDTLSATTVAEITGTWDPYCVDGIQHSVDFYNLIFNDKIKAYNLLIEALKINSRSTWLNQSLVEQCLLMNFTSYALDNLVVLKSLMSADEYHLYEEEVKQRIKVMETENGW